MLIEINEILRNKLKICFFFEINKIFRNYFQLNA